MGFTLDAVIDETLFVRDSLAPEKIGIHEGDVSDVVSVADAIDSTPGGIGITSLSPPRFRDTDSVIITGFGFSVLAGENEVRVSGTPATITSESDTSITFTVPGLFAFANDLLVDVVVENLTMGTTAHTWAWIKPSSATVSGYEIVGTEPDTRESPAVETPALAEAKDFERLVTLVDALISDQVPTPGDIMTRDDDGAAGLTGGHDGQVVEVDPAADVGLRWAWAADLVLPFGVTIPAATATEVKAVAQGAQDAAASGTNGRAYIATDGEIRIVWLRVREASTDSLDRVRVLVNGVQVYDSGTGLAKTNGQTFAVDVSLDVEAGDYVEIGVTKTGTAADMLLVGGLTERV